MSSPRCSSRQTYAVKEMPSLSNCPASSGSDGMVHCSFLTPHLPFLSPMLIHSHCTQYNRPSFSESNVPFAQPSPINLRFHLEQQVMRDSSSHCSDRSCDIYSCIPYLNRPASDSVSMGKNILRSVCLVVGKYS